MKDCYIAYAKLHVDCGAFVASLPLTDCALIAADRGDFKPCIAEGMNSIETWQAREPSPKLETVKRVLLAELGRIAPIPHDIQGMTVNDLLAELKA